MGCSDYEGSSIDSVLLVSDPVLTKCVLHPEPWVAEEPGLEFSFLKPSG